MVMPEKLVCTVDKVDFYQGTSVQIPWGDRTGDILLRPTCQIDVGTQETRSARELRSWPHARERQPTSRRPARARPKVSSSAYSRSPPTGRPLAIRVTFTGRSFNKLAK